MLLMSMLNRWAASGYDLARLLKEPIPLIWPVKHSQIYPALAELEARGEITGEWAEQRGRPSKKQYRLGEPGRSRLRAWLLEPRGSFTREEALLIAYNSHLIGGEAVVAAMRVFRRQAEQEILLLEARWTELAPSLQTSGTAGPRAAFDFGVLARRGWIAWCDQVVAQIVSDPPTPN